MANPYTVEVSAAAEHGGTGAIGLSCLKCHRYLFEESDGGFAYPITVNMLMEIATKHDCPGLEVRG